MEIDFFGKCHWNFTKRISIASSIALCWPDVQSLRELSVAQTEKEIYVHIYLAYSVSLSPLFRPYVNFSISCTNKAFFGVINHAPAVPRLSTKCLSITDPSVAVHSAELSKSPVAAVFRVEVSPEIVVRTHALPGIESRYRSRYRYRSQ